MDALGAFLFFLVVLGGMIGGVLWLAWQQRRDRE